MRWVGPFENWPRKEMLGRCVSAAGIDVGASELFVAVPADRDAEPVRSYPTFTRDLHELADWLQGCGIRSVTPLLAGLTAALRPAA